MEVLWVMGIRVYMSEKGGGGRGTKGCREVCISGGGGGGLWGNRKTRR